jgi:hypothetical protein
MGSIKRLLRLSSFGITRARTCLSVAPRCTAVAKR